MPTAPAILPTAISRARGSEPRPPALELGVVPGERQPEGDRLGVDAVAAADHRRLGVLPRARRERLQERVAAGEQHVGRVAQQHRERGVEHVARGHAPVQPARLDPGELLDVREERDDVVLGRPLDLVDAVGSTGRASCRGSSAAVPAGTSLASSMASQAASSTSSHTAKRRDGDQSARKSAGV